MGFFLKREQPAFVDIGTKNPGGASYQRISEEAGFLESTKYRYIDKVGKITPDGKVIAWYTLPREASNPSNLMTGPDGNLWFTEGGPNGSYLGRITPTGVITEFHEGYGDFGYTSIAAFGNDLWFAIGFYGSPGKIGRMPIK